MDEWVVEWIDEWGRWRDGWVGGWMERCGEMARGLPLKGMVAVAQQVVADGAQVWGPRGQMGYVSYMVEGWGGWEVGGGSREPAPSSGPSYWCWCVWTRTRTWYTPSCSP